MHLADGVVVLRPLGLDDVDEWLAGEDDEQIRWFEFPRPAVRHDLSYVVFPFARWQGIATRASMLALEYAVAQMGARVEVIKILEGNVASLAVARRLGAARVGVEASEGGRTFAVLRCELGRRTGPTNISC